MTQGDVAIFDLLKNICYSIERAEMKKNIEVPHWDESYSVGNDRIDHQHHYFLDLIEYLNENLDTDSSKEYVKSLLDEVILYARFHFCSEENMMKQYNYADFDFHKELHESLLREITSKITHFSMNKANLDDIILFLKDWFLSHTISEDRKFHQSLTPKKGSI